METRPEVETQPRQRRVPGGVNSLPRCIPEAREVSASVGVTLRLTALRYLKYELYVHYTLARTCNVISLDPAAVGGGSGFSAIVPSGSSKCELFFLIPFGARTGPPSIGRI